jgi:hypothetical protein
VVVRSSNLALALFGWLKKGCCWCWYWFVVREKLHGWKVVLISSCKQGYASWNLGARGHFLRGYNASRTTFFYRNHFLNSYLESHSNKNHSHLSQFNNFSISSRRCYLSLASDKPEIENVNI